MRPEAGEVGDPPALPDTSADAKAEVLRTQGPLLSSPEIAALYGQDGIRWNRDMVTWGDFHFAKLASLRADPYHWQGYLSVNDPNGGAGGGVYYEGPTIDYCLWARSGDQRFLDRANRRVRNAIEKVWLPQNGWVVGGFIWYNPRDVYLYWKATGDERACHLLNCWAQWVTHPYSWPNYGNTSAKWNDGSPNAMDNRTQARMLQCLLYAKMAQVEPTVMRDKWGPWQGTKDFGASLNIGLDKVFSSFDPEKKVPLMWANSSLAKPFMLGLLMSALIDVYQFHKPDPRIVPGIQGIVDYVRATCYDPSPRKDIWGGVHIDALNYLERDPATIPGSHNPETTASGGGTNPSAGLNGLFADGVAWLYKMTKAEEYRNFALSLMHGMVRFEDIGQHWGPGYPGMKQYNEHYTRQRVWGNLALSP